ncbi:MAG TPA: hypothetical protein VKB77_06140 [Terriglobales bacterium]|nr:hypothetical protein [Terriglobales bacterium]
MGDSRELHPEAELGRKSKPAQEALPVSRPAAWNRFLIPSVADLIFILLVLSLTVGALAPRLLGDAGTGWHIRNGELILETRSIPRADPFSATMQGRTWYRWEWLFDAAVAAIHGRTGLAGVVFLSALVIASSFTLTFRIALRGGAALPITVAMLMLAIGASAIHLFARPHIFSWLLALVWFEVLDSAEDSADTRRLYWLPALMLVWVNLHGGFVLGFALCGIYLIAGLVRLLRAKDSVEGEGIRRWIRHLAVASGISFLAGLVNPFGFRLYMHVYQYLSDRFLMDHIDEFRSPDFHGAAQQCFAALLLVAIAALAVAGARLRTSELLVVAFAVYSGLYASRNLPVSSILLVVILAPLVSVELSKASQNTALAPRVRGILARIDAFSGRMGALEARFQGHVWPVIVVIAGILLSVHHGRLGSSQLMSARFDSQRFPVAATDWIEAQGIREPIFSQDYWGGYVIYRLYPQSQVFLDDRHDFYGDEYLKRYLKIVRVEPGWDRELESLSPTWILLPRESTLTNILKEVPLWKAVYEDRTATLFRKENAGGDGP